MLAALLLAAASVQRPQGLELRDDARAELVAGAREREPGMGVQAFERARASGAADAEVERGAVVAAHVPRCERAPDAAGLLVGAGETVGQDRVGRGGRRPPLDAAGRLEPRDRGDKPAARDVVRRRERLALRVVRALLR